MPPSVRRDPYSHEHMFRSSTALLKTWWDEVTADILGGDLPSIASNEDVAPRLFDYDDVVGATADPSGESTGATVAESTVEYHRRHAHRAPLGSRRGRRPGTVPAAPAVCLCPVRHDAQRDRDAGGDARARETALPR